MLEKSRRSPARGTPSLSNYRRSLQRPALLPQNRKAQPQRFYYEHLALDPGDVILDVGAWVGTNLIVWGRQGHPVDGIEAAQGYVDAFHERIGDEDLPVRMFCCLIEEFEPDRRYDLATVGETLAHSLDPENALNTICDALKPGGRLFLATPTQRLRTHRHTFTETELAAMVERSGFRIEDFLTAYPGNRPGVPQWIVKARSGL